MIGIIDAGIYMPYYRLDRKVFADAWRLEQSRSLLVGERAVAGYDEDALTMAVEAALHALEPRESMPVDALYFASTTSPFSEKSSAAVIAAACDLPVHRTLDLSGTLRAGTSSLSIAFDALRAGSIRRAVTVAADIRRPEPGTLLEAFSGDGAAAVLVGSGSEVVAELVGESHLSDPTIDIWRRSEDRYLRSDDEAFTNQVGYFSLVAAALKELLQTTGVDPAMLKGLATYVPDRQAYLRLGRDPLFGPAIARMGKTAPALSLLGCVGNLGTAFPFAQLALLLETAQPDDLIALVGYGDGADAYLFRVAAAIRTRPAKRSAYAWIDNKGDLASYPLMLHFREDLSAKPLFAPGDEPWTSLPLLYRDRDELLRFRAQRCTGCGAVWWPHRPNCYECGSQVGFESVRLSRRGEVFSFTANWVIPSPLPPTGIVTVDTPDGARITTASTDGDPRALTIGTRVEFALRIFHFAQQMPHYSWKVRHMRNSTPDNETRSVAIQAGAEKWG